jgi:hypothetical protein
MVGAALAVVVMLLIDSQLSGLRTNYWLPAGIAMGIVGGGVIGLLFAEVWMGGRQDEEATATARAASERSGDGEDAI